ncbi:MAG: hypothetical protein HYX39_08315 [Bacteroidetes bacterium]|nr:hypothetical protein [Bacteroidota bacterium]
MITKLFTLAFICILFSCNNIKPDDSIATSKIELLTNLGDIEDDTLQQTKEETAPSDSPLLIARGSEPGWYAEFFKDRAMLVLNYGKDTVLVKQNFTTIASDKTFATRILEISDNKGKKRSADITIQINSKTCEEASGDKKDKQITITYNSTTYKGCAGVRR